MQCKWLSAPQSVHFGNHVEERVWCLQNQWKTSALVMTIYTHMDRYKKIAKNCTFYERRES